MVLCNHYSLCIAHLLACFLPFQEENLMKMYTKIFKAQYKFPPWFRSIQSCSSGFDLSSLIEYVKRKVGSLFTSRCATAMMVARIETVAKGLSFKVWKVKP